MSQQNWDQYFMSMAFFVAMKSKDASSKIGAVVVGPDNEVRSTGYNGFPRGVNDDIAARHERPLKYTFFEHAERNSVFNAARMGIATNGCTMYTNGIPCADCARAVVQSGIKKIVVARVWDEGDQRQNWIESCARGREILTEGGVEIVDYDGEFTTEITALQGGKPLSLKKNLLGAM